MNEFYDAIYLSPHFDDAALSCGGQIYDLGQAGQSVLIVTVMAGAPAKESMGLQSSEYVTKLHERWQLQDNAVEARKAEDIAASKVLGADWAHWDFLDCIYRVHPETMRPFYMSDAEIFGEVDPAERKLVGQVAQRIKQLPACNHLFLPLTLGHHVDHQLTRLAAEIVFAGRALSYYEDYPYARHESASEFVAGTADSWQARVIEISERGAEARIEAISCFKSQVSTFFNSQSDLANQVRAYIDLIGGERVWTKIISR